VALVEVVDEAGMRRLPVQQLIRESLDALRALAAGR
jgi:hypothetical protein